VADARRALLERLATEANPDVRDQLAESVGRLRAGSGDVARTAETLAALLPARGAVRGLFFLARQRDARGLIPAPVGARLQAVATATATPEEVRATAAAARIAAGGATPADLDALRRDPSAAVRVTAATAESIGDPAPVVRYRAVALAGCPALVTAAGDANAHVAYAAVDSLAKCVGDAGAVAAIERSPSPRAVVALAAVAPERARVRVAASAASRDPFVRVYAARAAGRLGDTLLLRRLARDADANVASEAIDGLSALTGHADDAVYVAALGSNASQQLMSAAKALAGSAATAPLTAALDRVTALRRETSRDARMALVEALGAAVPARYARDFDPAVATRAAALAGVAAAPVPLPAQPVPTAARLRTIGGATIEMADGGRIELRLFPFDAPTNAWRFARLARAGYFDGLTFHRVAPFFVVQGGSPLANEYVGDGPFTRDEVGRENRRGTVGVSTRGRDTGDGQIYFNTVDNARLDHDYTVFAEVVRGMEVVDRMQEGARIRRVTVRAAP
jgi:cyclophilin family peptidyl-prolyl cis-trans isomerase